MLFDIIGNCGHDHGACILGRIGIADIDGDTGSTDGEHRILMENGSAHVGQLAQFLIGDVLNGMRCIHQSGISCQHTGDIRPVLIQACTHCQCHNGTGQIGAAAGEGVDIAIGQGPVETGNHSILQIGQSSGELAVGLLCVERTVGIEGHIVCRIHKGEAQIGRNDLGVEVLAAACHIVTVGLCFQMGADHSDLAIHIEVNAQFSDDIGKAVSDLSEDIGKIILGSSLIVAGIQQIRDLDIITAALAGCGSDHVSSVGVGADDIHSLANLGGRGQRGSAEFHNDLIHICSSFPSGVR